MSIELCFASDGIVIADRIKHNAIDCTYSEMFKLVHEFLNACHRGRLVTANGEEFTFIRLKEGDGSPYPILVDGRESQLSYDDIKGIAI